MIELSEDTMQRFKKRHEESGRTLKDLSKLSGISVRVCQRLIKQDSHFVTTLEDYKKVHLYAYGRRHKIEEDFDINRLTYLRMLNGYSVEDVAKIMHRGTAFIRDIENDSAEPLVEEWHSLAKIFGVSVRFLLGIEGNMAAK